jgi:hypothetical protein
MIAPKRIVLEDTGERRYPKGNEIYVMLDQYRSGKLPPELLPIEQRISCADDYDGEWIGKPEDFAIYRIAEVVGKEDT